MPRPINITQENIDKCIEIIDLYEEKPKKGIGYFCNKFKMSRGSFFHVIRNNTEVRDHYVYARTNKVLLLEDKINKLGKKAMKPTIKDENGNKRVDNARVNAINIRIQGYKFLLTKILRYDFENNPKYFKPSDAEEGNTNTNNTYSYTVTLPNTANDIKHDFSKKDE